jgi:hypothetical protein
MIHHYDAMFCVVICIIYFIKILSHHPPFLVNVKPKRESLSTDTRTPTMPNPCDVMTCPRKTDTRLCVLLVFFSVCEFHIRKTWRKFEKINF